MSPATLARATIVLPLAYWYSVRRVRHCGNHFASLGRVGWTTATVQSIAGSFAFGSCGSCRRFHITINGASIFAVSVCVRLVDGCLLRLFHTGLFVRGRRNNRKVCRSSWTHRRRGCYSRDFCMRWPWMSSTVGWAGSCSSRMTAALPRFSRTGMTTAGLS